MPEFIDAMAGLDMVDIANAFKQWNREKEAFPTPAEIRKLTEHHRTIRLQRLGANIPKSWTQVIRSKVTGEIIAEFSLPAQQLYPVDLDARFGTDWRQSFRQE